MGATRERDVSGKDNCYKAAKLKFDLKVGNVIGIGAMNPRSNNRDATILAKVVGTEDFLQSALTEDNLADWSLAVELGHVLTRIEPKEILGHALLARAFRHLGDQRAAGALAECRKRLRQRRLAPGIRKMFRSFVVDEERLTQPTRRLAKPTRKAARPIRRSRA